MVFTAIAFLLGLAAGHWATRAIERLPLEDEFHHQFFSQGESQPRTWWTRIPLALLLFEPPEGRSPRIFDRLPLIPYFYYAWKYSNFRKLAGASRCPRCRQRLPWRVQVPILSFIESGGRCRSCRTKIPARLFVVELACGLLVALFAHRMGPTWLFGAATFMLVLFVVGSAIDWRHQIIPDEVNTIGLAGGLAFAPITQGLLGLGLISEPALVARVGLDYPYVYSSFSLPGALLGAMVGSGVFFLFGEIGGIVAGTDAMGGGDVKLAAFIGAFLGWQGILMTVFYSAVIGAAAGLLLLAVGGGKREGGFTKFAFGPYICMGAALVLYFGHTRLFEAYMGLSSTVFGFMNDGMIM